MFSMQAHLNPLLQQIAAEPVALHVFNQPFLDIRFYFCPRVRDHTYKSLCIISVKIITILKIVSVKLAVVFIKYYSKAKVIL